MSNAHVDVVKQLSVLYVEPDPIERKNISEIMSGLCAEVRTASDPRVAMTLFARYPTRLLVTAQQLPGMKGTELAASLRAQAPRLPYVLTDEAAEVGDLLAAMQLRPGPVAYLVKPLGLKQIKQALHDVARDLADEIRLMVPLAEGVLYCRHEGILRRDGTVYRLTLRERRLLDLLLERRGQWVHSERLLAAIYDDPDTATESGLKNLILRLRRKLGRDSIMNQYGVGYRIRLPHD